MPRSRGKNDLARNALFVSALVAAGYLWYSGAYRTMSEKKEGAAALRVNPLGSPAAFPRRMKTPKGIRTPPDTPTDEELASPVSPLKLAAEAQPQKPKTDGNSANSRYRTCGNCGFDKPKRGPPLGIKDPSDNQWYCWQCWRMFRRDIFQTSDENKVSGKCQRCNHLVSPGNGRIMEFGLKEGDQPILYCNLCWEAWTNSLPDYEQDFIDYKTEGEDRKDPCQASPELEQPSAELQGIQSELDKAAALVEAQLNMGVSKDDLKLKDDMQAVLDLMAKKEALEKAAEE